MMFHCITLECKSTLRSLKSFQWCGWKVIIVSALSLSLRDKERLIERYIDRESLTNFISSFSQCQFKIFFIMCHVSRAHTRILLVIIVASC